MITLQGAAEFIKRLVTGIILLVCCGGAYLHSSYLFSALLLVVLIIILTTEWPRLITFSRPVAVLISLVYPILPIALLVWLTTRFYTTDFYLPLYPFFVAWSADTCGYFLGKLIGNHKMCPTISPGKSWEGFAGSWIGVFTIHLWLIPRTAMLNQLAFVHSFLLLGLFTGLMTTIAFLGGFFLSYLKRKQNLKDAGSLLPGHGGFLDRFDAVFFVAYITIIITVLG